MSDSPSHTEQNDRPYRDIRDGLRERIALLQGIVDETQSKFEIEKAKREAAHKKNIEGLRATLVNYKNMLELEESFVRTVMKQGTTVGPHQSEAVQDALSPETASRPPLGHFLVAELVDHPQQTKDGLRDAAERAGYFPAGGGGRVIHATVMNLIRAQRIAVDAAGKYTVILQEVS